MNELLENVTLACIPVLIALISYVSAVFVKFINTKKEQVLQQTNNETVKTYVDLVTKSALEVVESLNSTIVEDLKSKTSDGKLTEDEIIAIRDNALSTLLDTLSDDMKSTLTTVFGDLEVYLKNLLETQVYRLKKGLNK